MIKIHHTDIKQICRDYTDVVMSINRRFNISNQYIAYVFNERNFKDIVSCPAINLHNEIDMFHKRFPEIDHKSDDWIKFTTYMTGQYVKIRKEYLQKVLDSLNLSVCPYCNRQYIFSAGDGHKVSAQFDHFYSKTKYPHLALSFYNLIPCCPTCNKAKGEESIQINPYIEDFGDNGKIQIDSLLNCILNDVKWDVKIESDDRCKTNIRAFALDELYKKHKDYAHEIVLKSIANQKGYFDQLTTTFRHMGITDMVIERILWGNYLDQEHWSDRPLSKMTVDIIKQLRDATTK